MGTPTPRIIIGYSRLTVWMTMNAFSKKSRIQGFKYFNGTGDKGIGHLVTHGGQLKRAL